MCVGTAMVGMGFSGNTLPLGTHLCLIYDSETERQRLLARFVGSGLAAGERVVYLAEKTTKTELTSLLGEMGIEVPEGSVTRCLEVEDAESVYCRDGVFCPRTMLEVLGQIQRETEASGYPCLRATGDMSWALKGARGSERLIEYEALLNDLVAAQPFLAVCQYDARRFDGQALYHVLQVHPFMIVRGRILRNPAYIGPREFMKIL